MIQIYTLSSSAKPDVIRYVGKTSLTLKKRLSKHMSDCSNVNTYKNRWIRKELKNGNSILIKSIYAVPSNEPWEPWEIFFIAQYKSLGYKLTNATKGGEGLHGKDNPFFGKKHDLSTRLKMSSLRKNKKAVNQYDLNGNLIGTYASIREADRQTSTGWSKISAVCNHQYGQKTAGGFVWRFEGDPFTLKYDNPAEHLRKAVCQYDKTGTLLNTYSSTVEASGAVGPSSGNISRCCNGSLKTAGGFVWRYKDDEFSYHNIRSDARAVQQQTMKGRLLKRYDSISQASKSTGIAYTSIRQCCVGAFNHAGGFKWKYA